MIISYIVRSLSLALYGIIALAADFSLKMWDLPMFVMQDVTLVLHTPIAGPCGLFEAGI